MEQRKKRFSFCSVTLAHILSAEFSDSIEQLCNRFRTQFRRLSFKLGSFFLKIQKIHLLLWAVNLRWSSSVTVATEQSATMTIPLPKTYSLLSLSYSRRDFDFKPSASLLFGHSCPHSFPSAAHIMKITIQSNSKWWISFEDYRVKR